MGWQGDPVVQGKPKWESDPIIDPAPSILAAAPVMPVKRTHTVARIRTHTVHADSHGERTLTVKRARRIRAGSSVDSS